MLLRKNMTDYKQQLERLKRHYNDSLKHYDAISFLDLAHTLRLWTEIKEGIDKISDKPTFRKAVITNNLKKILRDAEFAYAYFPDALTTSAAATGEKNKRDIVGGPSAGNFTFGGWIKFEENLDLSILDFLLIYRSLADEELRIKFQETKNMQVEKVSFSRYLHCPAIYFQFFEHDPKHISNEELIKRIANEYEASHADVTDTKFDLNNIFSEPVKRLMKYKVAQLPLPYFVLLHIARSIIDNLDGQL